MALEAGLQNYLEIKILDQHISNLSERLSSAREESQDGVVDLIIAELKQTKEIATQLNCGAAILACDEALNSPNEGIEEAPGELDDEDSEEPE